MQCTVARIGRAFRPKEQRKGVGESKGIRVPPILSKMFYPSCCRFPYQSLVPHPPEVSVHFNLRSYNGEDHAHRHICVGRCVFPLRPVPVSPSPLETASVTASREHSLRLLYRLKYTVQDDLFLFVRQRFFQLFLCL